MSGPPPEQVPPRQVPPEQVPPEQALPGPVLPEQVLPGPVLPGRAVRGRLLYAGNAVVDLVLPVTRLPRSGDDVLASSSRWVAGGGVTVMLAAAGEGLNVVYGGAHGTGPMGDLVRTTLHAAGIELAATITLGVDTGFVVTLVEPQGERTFVTAGGAENGPDDEPFDRLVVRDDDLVHVSGYALLQPGTATAKAGWVVRLPDSVGVFVDPGPLVGSIPVEALDAVLARADWFSANAREAEILTGHRDPLAAAGALAARTGRRAVMVRTGPQGCVLVENGGRPRVVPALAVRAVDTTGAGDVHAGVFLAAIAAGRSIPEAAHRANLAASDSVTRVGPGRVPAAFSG